jgi:hypothetical protein
MKYFIKTEVKLKSQLRYWYKSYTVLLDKVSWDHSLPGNQTQKLNIYHSFFMTDQIHKISNLLLNEHNWWLMDYK